MVLRLSLPVLPIDLLYSTSSIFCFLLSWFSNRLSCVASVCVATAVSLLDSDFLLLPALILFSCVAATTYRFLLDVLPCSSLFFVLLYCNVLVLLWLSFKDESNFSVMVGKDGREALMLLALAIIFSYYVVCVLELTFWSFSFYAFCIEKLSLLFSLFSIFIDILLSLLLLLLMLLLFYALFSLDWCVDYYRGVCYVFDLIALVFRALFDSDKFCSTLSFTTLGAPRTAV